MSRKVDVEFGSRLDEAEGQGRCMPSECRRDRQILGRRALRGDLVEPYPGLYCRMRCWSGLRPETRHAWVVRALAHNHPEWVFCDVSAAVMYGLPVREQLLDEVHVATKSSTHDHRQSTPRRHFMGFGTWRELGTVKVTSPERTVFDCAKHLQFPDALAIADAAIAHNLTSVERLYGWSHEVGGKWGAPRFRTVVANANGLAESWGESVARAQIIQLGFAMPELQKWFRDPVDGSRYRVDFLWTLPDGSLVAGEYDGRGKYSDHAIKGNRDPLDVLLAERRRESRITTAVSRVLRFSYADVMDAAYFERLLEAYGISRKRRRNTRGATVA